MLYVFSSWQDDVIEGGGAEWVFRLCGQWLHEDCVDVVQDQDVNQRFCSFCIDKYTNWQCIGFYIVNSSHVIYTITTKLFVLIHC